MEVVNGNPQGTAFVVEARGKNSAPWTIAATTTAARYTHKNQTPGARVGGISVKQAKNKTD